VRAINNFNYSNNNNNGNNNKLVQELGSRSTVIIGDSRETTYLFQQLSVALQGGPNTVFVQNMLGCPPALLLYTFVCERVSVQYGSAAMSSSFWSTD